MSSAIGQSNSAATYPSGGVIHRRAANRRDAESGIAKCGAGLSPDMRKVPTISALPDGSDATCKRCNDFHRKGAGR